MSDDKQTFIIHRTFRAPRDLVFTCLSEAKHLQHWWGPKGVTIVKPSVDFRVDGTFHYGMRGLNDQITYGRQVYREIVSPSKITLINSFSDEKAGLARAPFADKWPIELLTVFSFDEVAEGFTRFTVIWSPWNADEEERRVFASYHASMNGGWSGTFEQLDAYLETLKA